MNYKNWMILLEISFIYGCISLADGISRTAVITRAKFWADNKIPYDWNKSAQDPSGKWYRTDCSGYVSMAWQLSSSLTTVTLPNVAAQISKSQLQPGDVIMKGGPGTGGAAGHVVIFHRWTNSAQTYYDGYELTPPSTIYRNIPYPYWNGGSGYVPYRYNGIDNGGCQCCKEIGLRNYCGHELCGTGCNANDIYACSSKDTEAYRYGPCTLGCIGSTTNSKCRV